MLPANPTAHRKELAHRERMRLEQIEGKLDHVLAMGSGVGATAPAFSPVDVEEVGKLLVEGRMIRLPTHARLTVTTTVEEIRVSSFRNLRGVHTHCGPALLPPATAYVHPSRHRRRTAGETRGRMEVV